MENKFVVIDSDGNVPYAKGELPEDFPNFRAAERRAKELASESPGGTIGIYEKVGEVKAPVGKIESHRKYPIEHYK